MRKELWGKVKYKFDIFWKNFVYIFVYSISGFFAQKEEYKNLWIISERGDDAGDNGYSFFSYICKNHPECNVKYIIKKGVADEKKVKNIGEVIYFGSFQHYLAIALAKVLISSHILGFTTNDYLFQRFDRRGMIRGKKIFLQHGITYNDIPYLYYENTKPDLFMCAMEKEAEYVKEKFHQPENVVALTGLCRYDRLPLKKMEKSKIILVMPTWRKSLFFLSKKDFMNSSYYITWQKLLSSKRLAKILEENNYKLIFYPHHQMQKFVNTFSSLCSNVVIASAESYSVQDLLIHSDILITDFSSIFFDYAYMEKPMIYFQFDKKEFEKTGYKNGWFDYEMDGFGKVLERIPDVIDELEFILQRGCEMEQKYLLRKKNLFKYHDHKNCERNYNEIIMK